MVALLIIGFGVVLVINLLALLCKKDSGALNRDHVVIRHTAIGTVKLRKGERCRTRYTYGDKQ